MGDERSGLQGRRIGIMATGGAGEARAVTTCRPDTLVELTLRLRP